MILEPIIKHFDDQDSYKYTMNYFIFKKYLDAMTEWNFFNRGNHKFPKEFDVLLREQIEYFKDLRFTPEIEANFRKQYVSSDGKQLFSEDYYEFLRNYRYDPSQIYINQVDDQLEVKIKLSKYVNNMFWETQIMSVIAELLNITNNSKSKFTIDELNNNDRLKFNEFRRIGIKVIDMGMRRRFSFDNQDRVLNIAFNEYPDVFIGTSNVYFSRKYNVKAYGSVAHELTMALSTLHGPIKANEVIIKEWYEVFGDNLLWVLPDCYTTDAFLKVFDEKYSNLYFGPRHDSYKFDLFVDKILNHYKKFNIDTTTKTILHSDSIKSIETLEEMHNYRKGEYKRLYGIGTWISNNIEDIMPFNFVIKLMSAKMNNDVDKKWCVKISDDPGKFTFIDKPTLDETLFTINNFIK
jgi:nicotinate phosphoribosyltransferase